MHLFVEYKERHCLKVALTMMWHFVTQKVTTSSVHPESHCYISIYSNSLNLNRNNVMALNMIIFSCLHVGGLYLVLLWLCWSVHVLFCFLFIVPGMSVGFWRVFFCRARLFQTLANQRELTEVQALLLGRVSLSCFLLQDCPAGKT